jgi:uridylate kinase
MAEPVYRRVVIKLSGEYLAGSHPSASTSRPSTASPAT